MIKIMSKEEKDQYILDMIKQLKQEQTEFNTEKWGDMHNHHEMWGLALEEHEEAFEQLDWLHIHKVELWEMIKMNKPIADINHQLEIIVEYVLFAVQELIHEAAVYQRALDTIKNAPAAGKHTGADK
ncbi:hypothetical protein [Niameybacter massiliensis]|uniref:hypothetical protein n=1 Tax=Niameybacter massiliensis TaxID=1658108 RepID=UPI0006B659C1|nr:hypothetical protein [Niameybacter massiliensis]